MWYRFSINETNKWHKFAGLYMQDNANVPCQQIKNLKREGLQEPQISDQLGIPIKVVRFVVKHWYNYDIPYIELEKAMRQNREENPIQYNLPLNKINKTPAPRHRENRLKKMWFHGTTMENFNTIKDHYLVPGIGNFTEQFYADSYDPEKWEELKDSEDNDALYLSDWNSLNKSFAAMENQITHQLGRPATEKDYLKHGLLVVVEPFNNAYKYNNPNYNEASEWDHDEQSFIGGKDFSPPFAAESDDIYTRDAVKPFKFIYGRPLVRLYRKLKIINDDIAKSKAIKHIS